MVRALSCHSDGSIKYNRGSGYDAVLTPKVVEDYVMGCLEDGEEVLGIQQRFVSS